MTNKTVWVVEQGSYSDYRVVGVFSSQELAQQVANAINAPGEDKYSGEATIDEWPLDPAVYELQQGLVPFWVHMQEDGTVDRLEKQGVNGYNIYGEIRIAPAYVGKAVKNVLTATVWAKDEAHAVKITNEHRTRMIATGEWASDSTLTGHG